MLAVVEKPIELENTLVYPSAGSNELTGDTIRKIVSSWSDRPLFGIQIKWMCAIFNLESDNRKF